MPYIIIGQDVSDGTVQSIYVNVTPRQCGIAVTYQQLNPSHRYIFSLYHQEDDDIHWDHLQLVDSEEISSNINHHSKEPHIPMRPGLDAAKQKYCSCVLKVGAKGGAYNRYAVCAKSTGTSSKECGKYYDWEKMDDKYLIAYANGKDGKISVPSPYRRRQMLDNINKWKESA